MSGSHNKLSELCDDVCRVLLGREERKAVSICLDLILPFQMLYDKWTDQWYQVISGSGMGAKASGSISDAAFMTLFELGCMMDTKFRSDFGVLAYIRLRDDLLLITCTQENGLKLTEKLKALCNPTYEVSVDCTSLLGVPFLDLFVCKWFEHGQAHLRWRPYVKPTARHVPLSDESWHSFSTHRT